MQKNKKKISLIKMITICLILVLLSGAGVMAVTTQVNTVKIELSNGYEMTVLTSKTNVKEILEDHKFKYGIDSSPNKGTCFYFKCKIISKNKKE